MATKLSKTKKSRIVQEIKTPKDIDYGSKANADMRKSLVFELTIKGLSIPRIAQALNVSEKTVQRDQIENREKMAKRAVELRSKFANDEHFTQRLEELTMMKTMLYTALTEQRLDRSQVVKRLLEINLEIDNTMKKLGIKVEDSPTKASKLEISFVDQDNDDADDEDEYEDDDD